MSDVAQIGISALPIAVGVFVFIFRRQFALFAHQMNSEREIKPGETPPWRYSPAWMGFGGCAFVVIGIIIGVSGVIKLVSS
ncbi:MAG: hypothetical protein JWQ19_2246 [Subtercola sp.]|nr:hypothetical protein [Subtercola sp.]